MKKSDNYFKPRQAVDKFISKAYAGGRVEVFQANEFEKVNVYDINSLYPSVMLEKMPINTPKKAYKFHEDRIGVYHVKFNQFNKKIPAVLWAKSSGFSLEFIYKGEGYFFSNEIEKAIKVGTDIEIIDGYVWTKSKAIFKDFINYFYNLRQENKNNVLNYICKIILNSLYGKFGQREEKSRLIFIPSHKKLIKMLKSKKYHISIYDDKIGLYQITESQNINHRLIYLSAYITSLARVKLYQSIDKDTIYCDTDSIHTSHFFNGKISDKLGDWKLEATGKGIYVARKGYMIGESVKFKGMKTVDKLGAGNKLLNFEDYQQILKGAQIEKTYHTFPKVKQILKGKAKACKIIESSKVLKRGEYLTNFENSGKLISFVKNYPLHNFENLLMTHEKRDIKYMVDELDGWKGYNNQMDFTPIQDEKPLWLTNSKQKTKALFNKGLKNKFNNEDKIIFDNIYKNFKKYKKSLDNF